MTNERLCWMFRNCFPNTLDTTVHYREDEAVVAIDAFDRSSHVEIVDEPTVADYTTRNSGGVPRTSATGLW